VPKRNEFPITPGQRVDPDKALLAKALRHTMTAVEQLLWDRLRRRGAAGFHFRRQQVIAGFIADFYCAKAGLPIELDGGVHDAQRESDLGRDRAIAELGIETLRIKNEELLKDLDAMVEKIVAIARSRI
jgi:very-short-patch-repair endonuclease